MEMENKEKIGTITSWNSWNLFNIARYNFLEEETAQSTTNQVKISLHN